MDEPTKDDVKSIADELMDKNGVTTTLDVKTQLRSKGFWADQKKVSQLMSELADEHNWVFSAGPYRTYSKSGIAPASGGPSGGSTSQQLLKLSQSQPATPSVPQPKQNTPGAKDASGSLSSFIANIQRPSIKISRDWYVYPAKTISRRRTLVSITVKAATRDAARWAFVAKYGGRKNRVFKDDVRAKKV